jgi:hypothetical protein
LACSPGILAGIQFRRYPTKVQSHARVFVPHTAGPKQRIFFFGTSGSSGPRKGWKEIAGFLGLPISAAQRWARSGMSIAREGRSVQASVEELNRGMERETSEPVPIATEAADSSAELRRGLWYGKKQKQARNQKNVAEAGAGLRTLAVRKCTILRPAIEQRSLK